MKIFSTVLIVLMLLNLDSVNAQTSCYPGGINISSQQQIDDFAQNHPSCTEIEGYLYVSGNDITDLSGLAQLKSAGIVKIFINESLASLNGLDNLETVTALVITDNPVLVDISALSNLTTITGSDLFTVQNLSIENNAMLANLNGLEGITQIPGTVHSDVYFPEALSVQANPKLQNLSGLDNLEVCEGDLVIRFNDALENLKGLENLRKVEGLMSLGMNLSLSNLEGLENLDSIGGSMKMINNPGLLTLSHLNDLEYVGGGLSVHGNTALKTLEGLEGLDALGGDLEIIYIDSLNSLEALENLTSIGGELEIRHNPKLTSLTGIQAIDHHSITKLNISNCLLLSECDVQSVCDYLEDDDKPVTIYGNASGCANQGEVGNSCFTVSLSETVLLQENIRIFPNPNAGDFQIENQSGQEVEVAIWNAQGMRITGFLLSAKDMVDISNYTKGIYFIKTRVKNSPHLVRKVIVIE